MIQIIFGEIGTGKTKRIIDMANKAVDTVEGSIVFIDAEGQSMFDLKNAIRFIDASEYGIDSPKMFYGFITGIAAQDYDLECFFVDGFLKIIKHPLDTLEEMFADLAEFSEKHNMRFVISMTGSETKIPPFLTKYVV